MKPVKPVHSFQDLINTYEGVLNGEFTADFLAARAFVAPIGERRLLKLESIFIGY